jgi:hypothetical protein
VQPHGAALGDFLGFVEIRPRQVWPTLQRP